MTPEAASSNVWTVVAIMLSMGALGGSINHFLIKENEDAGVGNLKSRFGRAFWIGIGASLLIPLFLNTISSTLLDDTLAEKGLGSSGLILAGFCLLAAMSSRAFIQTLSDRVLRQVKEAKEDAAQAVEQVEAIADSVSEPSSPAEQPKAAAVESSVRDAPSGSTLHLGPTKEEREMLEAIENSKYTMRSTWGLAQDLGKSTDEMEGALHSLGRKGWVAQVQGKKGLRWIITAMGRGWIRK